MAPFSPGKRVVVLGAGATRGATTLKDGGVKPPLNADFFTQVQRITTPKHVANVEHVIKDVVELFGPNFSLTMEDYFTQLESFVTMSALAPARERGLNLVEIRAKLRRLMAVLAAVLEESTDVSKKDSPVCEHHAKIVSELKPKDTIISFNYDCVADHALRTMGTGRWSAKYGYSLPRPDRIRGHDHWDAPSPPAGSNGTINLLKLHGSLNWKLPIDKDGQKPGEIRLKQRLYQQNGIPRFTIIPPAFVKNIQGDSNFEALWRNAERAIRNAEMIALVGFSFTPTDLHVESLFRIALAGNNNLHSLVIANPSQDDRRRIRSVFSQSLSHGCLVRQYSTLADLAASVPSGVLG